MDIPIDIVYAYTTTTGNVKETVAVAHVDIVDIAENITFRFRNEPHISNNIHISGDPFDQPVVIDLDWANGEFVVIDGFDLFNKVIILKRIPSEAQLSQLFLRGDTIRDLMSLKHSIAMVRKEHDRLATVAYCDWDTGMKLLEKMYRVANDC